MSPLNFRCAACLHLEGEEGEGATEITSDVSACGLLLLLGTMPPPCLLSLRRPLSLSLCLLPCAIPGTLLLYLSLSLLFSL